MKIDSMIIDTTKVSSILCVLGGIYNTDKSPYNSNSCLHKHPYTGIYNLLFHQYINKEFLFVEIGIEHNASMKMWGDYFKKANIVGFEYYEEKIKKAESDKLKNVRYAQMDVTSVDSIKSGFEKLTESPSIIIDDSTHNFDDQIRIIKTALPYLKSNGILIVEDIFKHEDESRYVNELRSIGGQVNYATFITANHLLEHTPDWDNSKLLVIFKI